jgi:predicted ATPase/class 3 adenylate cyclase/Tfp pilus assembly protein PilF
MADRDVLRKELPRGTVTLFFADVEGSTRLIHALGDRYAEARARGRELVREAASACGGYEVDWAGDGAFLAFERARDAIGAAVELQRAFHRESWPRDVPVRMRIGVHTGEPELSTEGYVGMDVHIAARICSAAHGGQIVVSRATRDFAGDALPGVSFRPLGSHRLKDVGRAHQLFQLAAPELEESFPPLQALGGATLPALHHRLVGRRENLDEIAELLSRPLVRLVTIVGPGGAGKSRLALEVAASEALERPVHLVGLAPISNPDLVPAAIARTIGVRETAGRQLLDQIADELAGTGALLFLDNLEHLPLAASHVRALLDLTPDLDVLTTSRVPLQLSGEHVVPLQPLHVDDASMLFEELAAARGVVLGEDTLASVHQICQRLDGLPLAIELVAARLVVLPPTQILKALDQGLALEMEGPVDLPERQRTLRATLDWSYGLLTDGQRKLHGILAVFPGGCSLDDARALAGHPRGFLGDLEALVGWSLLRSDVMDGSVRLSMLETVREHAIARLALEGDLEDLRRRHAERFLELAEAAETALAGPDQAGWLVRLENELDNIRAALDWFFSSGRVEDGLRAASSLHRFWRGRSHVSEARRWLSLGLSLETNASPDVRARALWTAAHQADAQSDWEAAIPLLEEALALFRECGHGREASFALSELGFIALMRGDPAKAETLCDEALSLARELGDKRATSAALNNLGEVCSAQGDHERALAHHDEAVGLRRALGDPELASASIYSLGVAAFRSGDLARARAAFEESLSISRALGESLHTAAQLFMLAELDLLTGDVDPAEQRIREAYEIYTSLENDRERAACIVVLSGITIARESYESAAQLLGAAEALRGDSPLELAELTVLERFQPELESAISESDLVELKALGARLGHEALIGEVVPTGTWE